MASNCTYVNSNIFDVDLVGLNVCCYCDVHCGLMHALIFTKLRYMYQFLDLFWGEDWDLMGGFAVQLAWSALWVQMVAHRLYDFLFLLYYIV